ncbi:MAG TPA: serine/threonine-protein kinase [Polyangia bacterium]
MALDAGLLDTPYRIVRLIGEGGMGRVYEATHTRLAGRYAVKVLLNRLSHNPDAVALFEREAKVTSSLQHPNIVQVIDFNATADGTEYLVMEHLRGESLAQRLRRERSLSLDETASVVEQVAAGLMAAHAHGVIHRDLKPDNVFLVPVEGSPRAWAKILDFGIALIRKPGVTLKNERVLVGTPLYMSPEQLSLPAAAVDAATDQFALAVMTYEMLTGRVPFEGKTIEAVITQVLTGEPAPIGINAEVDAVVRRGLAKSPNDRYPSVIAFARALRTAVTRAGQGQVDPATVASPTEPEVMMGEVARVGMTRGRLKSMLPLALAAVVASVAVASLWKEPLTQAASRLIPALHSPAASRIVSSPELAERPAPVATAAATLMPLNQLARSLPDAKSRARVQQPMQAPRPFSQEQPIALSDTVGSLARQGLVGGATSRQGSGHVERRSASAAASSRPVRVSARLRTSGRAMDTEAPLSPSPLSLGPTRARGMASQVDPILADADAPMPPSDPSLAR